MSYRGKAAVGAAVLVAASGGAFAQSQKVTGPIAQYWVSAATSSGFSMGGMGGPGGGRPDTASMMSMMMGGGRGQANHQLTLQLGSMQAASGSPQADHLPPQSLGAGPDLPLVTPDRPVPGPRTDDPDPRPPEQRKPEGRMLIFWGCGEHAGPNQPIVIDFANMMKGQVPNIPMISVRTERAPSPDRFRTYGEWPNRMTRTQVPPQGSLVGAHTVKGNYSPDINFNLGPEQDFLAPLTITGQSPTPAGATQLTWNPVPGATGFSAWMIGGMGGPGGRGEGSQVVIWTSSQTASMMGALMDYIPPAEVRRLVAERAVMSPQTTSCTIPAEVTKASPQGLLSMIAYGDEVNLYDPPRPRDPKVPWDIRWHVKVRYKSTTGAILGMNMPGMSGGEDDGSRRGPPRGRQQPQQPGRPSMGGMLGGALRGGLPF